MMKPGVELVLIPPGDEGLVEPLAQLEVEDAEAKLQQSIEVVRRLGKRQPVPPRVDHVLWDAARGNRVGGWPADRHLRSP